MQSRYCWRGHFEVLDFPRTIATPRLGVTSAKNANQFDSRASADAELTSPGLLVLKTSSKSGLPIAWITGHASIPAFVFALINTLWVV